jgi:hypothetical protein
MALLEKAMNCAQDNSATQIKSRCDKFIELSNRWSKMARKEGLNVVPFYDGRLPHFSALGADEQGRVLWQLET